MNPLITFMASPAGRIIRIVAGGGLIAWGVLGIGGMSGLITAGVGAVPILTGALNICVLAPLLGAPISGSKVLERS